MKKETYTLYHGVSYKSYDNIWKPLFLLKKTTNSTFDLDFAFDYSYDFEKGKYDDIAIEHFYGAFSIALAAS
jgi:hypothetical protein